MEIDKEFEEKYLSKRTVIQEPSVSKIKEKSVMQSIAEQHKNNSEYFLECAKNLLITSTPLAAVLIGHFAMEHKATSCLLCMAIRLKATSALKLA